MKKGEGRTDIERGIPLPLLRSVLRLAPVYIMDIVSAIASRLNWDYDAVHIERGEKAENKELWPNLAADTSLDALLSNLADKIEDGRHIYIAMLRHFSQLPS